VCLSPGCAANFDLVHFRTPHSGVLGVSKVLLGSFAALCVGKVGGEECSACIALYCFAHSRTTRLQVASSRGMPIWHHGSISFLTTAFLMSGSFQCGTMVDGCPLCCFRAPLPANRGAVIGPDSGASAVGKPEPGSIPSLDSAASSSVPSMLAAASGTHHFVTAPSAGLAAEASGMASLVPQDGTSQSLAPASPTATSPVLAAAAAAALAAMSVSGAPADAIGLGLPEHIARAISSSPVKAVAGVGPGLPSRQLTWPPPALRGYKPGMQKAPELLVSRAPCS
jgi:hypothetical protein